MSSKTDTTKSVEMHQVVGAILKDITKAREISDRYSNYVGEGYRPKLTDEGSIENENQLISYSVPRAEISDVNVNLKFAIDKVEEAQDADEANQFFFNTIIEKYLDILTDAYLNTVKTVENFSTQQLQSYQINIRDSIAQWIQDTFICEISEEQKNLQIQIKKEKESIKKTIIEDFTNHLKKIPIPLSNIFEEIQNKTHPIANDIVNLYKENFDTFKEHLEIERPELLAANNTDSGEVNLKFKDSKIKEYIILKKDKSKWEEGISWREQTTNTTNLLRSIAFGNGLWVAVGEGGTILTSIDGISWIKQTSNTTERLYGISYNNGIWVVVGSRGVILTSSNGTSWTKRVSNTTKYLTNITYGNGVWVAIGHTTIVTSNNGISWTLRMSWGTYRSNYPLQKVAYGNGMWVIAGHKGHIFTSSNGTSWTKRTTNTTEWLYGIIYKKNMWIVVGNNGTILTSSNGTSWTKRVSNTTDRLSSISYNNDIWIMASKNDTFISNDGISWKKQTTKSIKYLYSAVHGNGMWITVDHNGAIFTNADNGNIKSFVNELYELEQQAMDSRNEQQVMDSRQKSILTKIQDNLKNDDVIKESIEKIPTEKMLFKKDDQLMIQVELDELKKRERVSEINFKTNIKNHKWLRGEKGMFNLIPEE